MTQSYTTITSGQSLAASLALLNNNFDTLRDKFAGLTDGAITPVAYQWWLDTTAGKLKIRNAANSAWVDVGDPATSNLGHLRVDGSLAMTGALDFGTNKGINLVDPTNPQDAATIAKLKSSSAKIKL